jgi:hypothetical protein
MPFSARQTINVCTYYRMIISNSTIPSVLFLFSRLSNHLFKNVLQVGSWLEHRVLLIRADPSPRKWWWDWIAPPPLATSRGGLVALGALIIALGLHLQYWCVIFFHIHVCFLCV